MTTISEPILIVGAGGAGARLAPTAAARLGAPHIAISNSAPDIPGEGSIMVSTAPILNPTVHAIRGAVRKEASRILEAAADARTVVIIASLAGRSGAGIAPGVAALCADAGKKVVSFAIMPFGYEKDRIFGSGMALKRLREKSDCSIVIDNDAILEGNPNLGVRSCYEMVNSAIMHIVGSLGAADIPDGQSVVSTAAEGAGIEQSLRDSIKMLYENAPPGSVTRSLLYVMGDDVPVGAIGEAADTVSGITGGSSAAVAAGGKSDGVIMLSEIAGATKFDSYDPLGAIPASKTIDWEEAESSVAVRLDIDQLER